MVRIAVLVLVVAVAMPAFAQQPVGPVACEPERRALDMYAAQLRSQRSDFELSAFRTMADLELRLKAALAALAELETVKKKPAESPVPPKTEPPASP